MNKDNKLYDAIKTDNIFSLITEMNKLKIRREDIVQFICNDNNYILIFCYDNGRES